MNHGHNNRIFLDRINPQTRRAILIAVASRYGISRDAALSEVSDKDAEHLLDYLTGSMRTATSVLMQAAGLTLAR